MKNLDDLVYDLEKRKALNIHSVVKSLVCLNNYKDQLTQDKTYDIISENVHNDYSIVNDLGEVKHYHRSWFDWKK